MGLSAGKTEDIDQLCTNIRAVYEKMKECYFDCTTCSNIPDIVDFPFEENGGALFRNLSRVQSIDDAVMGVLDSDIVKYCVRFSAGLDHVPSLDEVVCYFLGESPAYSELKYPEKVNKLYLSNLDDWADLMNYFITEVQAQLWYDDPCPVFGDLCTRANAIYNRMRDCGYDCDSCGQYSLISFDCEDPSEILCEDNYSELHSELLCLLSTDIVRWGFRLEEGLDYTPEWTTDDEERTSVSEILLDRITEYGEVVLEPFVNTCDIYAWAMQMYNFLGEVLSQDWYQECCPADGSCEGFRIEVTITDSTMSGIQIITGGGCLRVDWGDWTDPEVVSGNASHDYVDSYGLTVEGTYTIDISGFTSSMRFEASGSNYGDNEIITAIYPIRKVYGLTSLWQLFFEQGLITEVPADFFDYVCTEVKNFHAVFWYTSLSAIPSTLLANCSSATNFSRTFSGTNISEIPEGLFDNCFNVATYSATFAECSELVTIPEYLFAQCISPFGGSVCDSQVLVFERVFKDCVSLGSPPDNIFWGCSSAWNFRESFMNSAIDNLRSLLFRDCIAATCFEDAFRDTGSLFEVPDELFEACTLATQFSRCFMNSNVYRVGSGIFSQNTLAARFDQTFNGCTRLNEYSPLTYFSNCPDVDTFYQCFGGCSSLNGEAPALWDRDNNPYGEDCFSNCKSLDNYDEIPDEWK